MDVRNISKKASFFGFKEEKKLDKFTMKPIRFQMYL